MAEVSRTLSLLFLIIPLSSTAEICHKTTTLSGFESELTDVKRELRAVIRIIDGCSFSVHGLRMRHGTDDIRWWGAPGTDLESLASGFEISDHPLDRSTTNATLTVHLLPSLTWDQFNVLAIWDKSTASPLGHVVLRPPSNEPSSIKKLSDMYNNSVFLDDQQVIFFWTLTHGSISMAARGERQSRYLAIGFGDGMANSFAYVGWIDNSGKGRVRTYRIDGYDASSIHSTSENITNVSCRSENGVITFEFTRHLLPSCSGDLECTAVIDPTTPLNVVWAMGTRWSDDDLSYRNMHSMTSGRPVRVLLLLGLAEAWPGLPVLLAAHGLTMVVAWSVLLPAGVLAARYLKHMKGDRWYQIHACFQYSGLAFSVVGILLAAVWLRGLSLSSLHVKFGVAAMAMACMQAMNACLRPRRPGSGQRASLKGVLLDYVHVILGRVTIVAGILALFSGMKYTGDRYDSETVETLTGVLMLWFLVGSFIIIYIEYLYVTRTRRGMDSLGSNCVSENGEEDDSVNLLHPYSATELEIHPTDRSEVQLEPLST